MSKETKVIQSVDEVPTEVLATSIVAISEGIRKLRSGRLNDRALYLLIQHASPNVGGKYQNAKVGLSEVKAVIEGMESLEATFLKRKTPISHFTY